MNYRGKLDTYARSRPAWIWKKHRSDRSPGGYVDARSDHDRRRCAEKKTEMGRKFIVPYALYQAEGYISANLARKVTHFSEDDLNLLWQAIINMFENDHSAARGNMAVRELIVFKHDSELGNAPSYKLFERVHVARKDPHSPARSYSDYEVHVDTENMPQGVTLERKI